MLLSLVNLFYYQDLMQGARAAIAAGNFTDYRDVTKESWARGDMAPIG
jgi:queuine tRNA-ribosyltransferase